MIKAFVLLSGQLVLKCLSIVFQISEIFNYSEEQIEPRLKSVKARDKLMTSLILRMLERDT